MEGTFKKPPVPYKYTMDDGTDIIICLDETVASAAGNGLVKQTTASTLGGAPLRFQPRVVFWKGILDGKPRRKEIVCQADSTLFKKKGSSTLTIDGVSGVTTGRRGEKQSFICTVAPAAATTPDP